MADYDSSLPVRTRTTEHLQSNITQVGGTTIGVTNPVFAELTDGTNAITSVTIAATQCLDINLGGVAGTAMSVTNPVFAELTDGTTAITSVTIAATQCLDINIGGVTGAVTSATNPLFVEITDGTNAIGVSAASPIYVSSAPPGNTFIEFTTGTVNTGATDTTTFKKEAAAGDIYVQRIIVSASGAFKAEVNYTQGAALSVKAVDFATSAFPKAIFEFDCYEACACSQANDGIHVHVTSRETANMDVYCSIIGHT